MADQRISDNEIVVLRIPPGKVWFELPDRITSANFKLKSGATGLSVFRLSLAAEDEVLSPVRGGLPGSFLVSATVGSVRECANAAGELFHLDVVDDDESGENPGHALIVAPGPGKFTKSISKSLQKIFQIHSP